MKTEEPNKKPFLKVCLTYTKGEFILACIFLVVFFIFILWINN